MAKTNAQRQAEYRARRINAGEKGDGEARLNTWVSSKTDFALERLAKHYGVTKREMIERLILHADDQTGKTMTDEEFDRYLQR